MAISSCYQVLFIIFILFLWIQIVSGFKSLNYHFNQPLSKFTSENSFRLPQKPLSAVSFQPSSIDTSSSSSSIIYEDINGGWLPVASISSLDPILPTQIEIAGEKYVVWKSPNISMMKKVDDTSSFSSQPQWNVMKDMCSHRSAPLSQGRIDKQTGCIECPYHGWQFNHQGSCTKIPQLDPSLSIPKISTSVDTFPIKIIGDLLFSFLPLPGKEANYFQQTPEEILPVLKNITSFFTRDLPYSFDFVVENFMDPAHIPFAHHTLQSTRDDGCPVPMESLTSLENSSTIEVTFEDKSKGKVRIGKVSFTSPCFYHFRLKLPPSKIPRSGLMEDGYQIILIILIVPISPGKSRVMIGSPMFPSKQPKWIKWFLHFFTNRFLDSDIWLHDQERFLRGLANSYFPQSMDSLPVIPKYMMPTQSDYGPKIFRQWWKRHLSKSPIFGPSNPDQIEWIPLDEQRDYYENHAKYCIYCRDALRIGTLVQKWSPMIAIFGLALARNLPQRLLAASTYGILLFLSSKVVKMINGPSRDEKTTAAQFPEKKSKSRK